MNYLPNYLCTSAGGHVSSGEEYEAAAKRELFEEIGLEHDLELINKFIYMCPGTTPSTPRFISLYVAYASDGFTFNDREVADGFFMDPEELQTVIERNENIHPQLGPCLEEYWRYLDV